MERNFDCKSQLILGGDNVGNSVDTIVQRLKEQITDESDKGEILQKERVIYLIIPRRGIYLLFLLHGRRSDILLVFLYLTLDQSINSSMIFHYFL